MITEASPRIRSRLARSTSRSTANGSSAGPSEPHQACVQAYTSAAAAASVVMSSAEWPGVRSSRTDGLSAAPSASRLVQTSPW